MITVYVSIGNSDDKLSQFGWMCFQTEVRKALNDAGVNLHGDWHSHPLSQFQNACWCFEILPGLVMALKGDLERIARNYNQDSIAWAVAETTFIEPAPATV